MQRVQGIPPGTSQCPAGRRGEGLAIRHRILQAGQHPSYK